MKSLPIFLLSKTLHPKNFLKNYYSSYTKFNDINLYYDYFYALTIQFYLLFYNLQ